MNNPTIDALMISDDPKPAAAVVNRFPVLLGLQFDLSENKVSANPTDRS